MYWLKKAAERPPHNNPTKDGAQSEKIPHWPDPAEKDDDSPHEGPLKDRRK